MIKPAISKFQNLFGGDETLRKVTAGSGIALALKVGSAGLTFLMFAYLARAMSKNDFGVFSFSFSIAMFGSVIAGLGLQTAILKWPPAFAVRGQPNNARNILFWGAGISLTSSLFLSAIALFGTLFFASSRGEAPSLVAAAVLIVPLTLAEFLASALRSKDRIAFALLPKDILWRLSAICLALVFLQKEQLLSPQFCLWFLGVSLGSMVIGQFLFLRFLAGRRTQKSSFDMRALLLETVPMWGASVLFAFTQHVDVVLIGLMLRPEVVGPYFAAVKIANLLGLMLIASNMVSAPMISRYYAANDMKNLQRTLRIVSIGISLPTLAAYGFLVLFGRMLLGWFGDGYEIGYVPLLLVGAGFAFNAICGPTGYLMQMTGDEGQFLKIMLVTYLFVIILQIILISMLGANGAAVGTLFGLIMWNLWARGSTIKRIGVDPTLFQFCRASW